jgi:hypothetical protein
MSSLYDTIADSCDALAAKAEHKSDKARLQQLAVYWRSVAADKEGEAPGRPWPLGCTRSKFSCSSSASSAHIVLSQ